MIDLWTNPTVATAGTQLPAPFMQDDPRPTTGGLSECRSLQVNWGPRPHPRSTVTPGPPPVPWEDSPRGPSREATKDAAAAQTQTPWKKRAEHQSS